MIARKYLERSRVYSCDERSAGSHDLLKLSFLDGCCLKFSFINFPPSPSIGWSLHGQWRLTTRGVGTWPTESLWTCKTSIRVLTSAKRRCPPLGCYLLAVYDALYLLWHLCVLVHLRFYALVRRFLSDYHLADSKKDGLTWFLNSFAVALMLKSILISA